MYTGEKPFTLEFFAASFAASAVNAARLVGAVVIPAFLYRSVRYVTTRDPA